MNKNHKILYIITQGESGGAQKYVHDLAVNLAKDYDITVAVGEPHGQRNLQSRITSHIPHIKMVQLTHLVRRISPIHDILALFELRKLYRKLQPDIIHLNSSKAGLLGSLAKWYVLSDTCYVIYTVHGWVFNEPLSKLKKKLYFLLEKYTAKFKDKIIVLNEKEWSDATNLLKIPQKKLTIVPPGIDIKQNYFNKVEAKEKLKKFLSKPILENDYVVGTIANHYKTKGLDVLIKAAAKIKEKNIHFIIIGDGPQKNDLQLQITNYKLQNFYLLGSIENASAYLKAFDLFVLPSRKEGFPYTILEAMAQNIPVITTDVGGIGTLVQNKKTGFVIKPDDVDELAKTICKALLLQDQIKTVTTQAYEEIKKYTLEKMISKTTSVYQHLLK